MPREPAVPSEMQALQLPAYDGLRALRRATVPVPRPAKGQVLVKVIAAPVNPSDVMFCLGLYGVRKPLPAIPGFEGCGVVVSSGGGMLGKALLGRRVACAARDDAGGTWAEYALADASGGCVPLPDDVPDEVGAAAIVNPFTAWTLVEPVRRGWHRAMVQTAANSQLGKMIVRLGLRYRLPLVHVVRRAGAADELRALGAARVLDSSRDDFDSELKRLCAELKATYAVDAVGGATTARVLAAMPEGSVVRVYGALALEAAGANPADLIFGGKRVEGFWVKSHLERKSLPARLNVVRHVRKLLSTDLRTDFAARLTLTEAATELAGRASAGGKWLIRPGACSPRALGA